MYVFSVRLVDKTSLKTKAPREKCDRRYTTKYYGYIYRNVFQPISLKINAYSLGKSYIISLTIITSIFINLILTKGNKYE